MNFTELKVQVVDKEDHPEGKTGFFEVIEDFSYCGSFNYTVPAGALINFASIPRVLRWLFNRFGPSRKAAAIHDHMYEVKWKTRKQCDEAFREMLEARKVNVVTRNTYKAGVRLGGWTRGTKDTRDWTWN